MCWVLEADRYRPGVGRRVFGLEVLDRPNIRAIAFEKDDLVIEWEQEFPSSSDIGLLLQACLDLDGAKYELDRPELRAARDQSRYANKKATLEESHVALSAVTLRSLRRPRRS